MKSCLLTYILIGAYLFSIIGMMTSKSKSLFINTLNANQHQKYKQIYNERKYLTLQGLLLGSLVVAACFYLGYMNNMSTKCKVCVSTTIILGITWLYYSIMPKQMITNHLTTQEQMQLWTRGYKHMQYMTTLGMIIGIFLFLIVMYYNKINILEF